MSFVGRDEMSASDGSKRYVNNWDEYTSGVPSESEISTYFQHIITKGRKDNTYKLALARFLIEHAAQNKPSRTISYETIADAFLKYYWHQECKYRIRQNAPGKHDPSVITAIRKVFGEKYLPDKFEDMSDDKKQRARKIILKKVFGHEKNKTSMVIPRFQNVKSGTTITKKKIFYEYDDDAQQIMLRPEALEFLKNNRIMLYNSVILEWVTFLEKVNRGMPMLVAKTTNIYGERGSLVSFRKILQLAERHCFYCNSSFHKDTPHVDHFIPWSYVFEDEMWNLVLSCPRCNTSKSDSLAAEKFLIDLIKRNSRDDIPKLRESVLRLGPDVPSKVNMQGQYDWKYEIRKKYENCTELGFLQWSPKA